jgi:MFS transporter, PAT family, solute carrier family 33 (acetyl-CoA transportor), member 1
MQVALYGMFVSVMGFFARISDPLIGGTYMTLLNTVYNLGGNWPNTLVLSFVDELTWATCAGGSSHGEVCQKKDQKEVRINVPYLRFVVLYEVTSSFWQACESSGGNCSTDLDGFYVQMLICTIFGLFWFKFFRKRITALQNLPERAWRIRE